MNNAPLVFDSSPKFAAALGILRRLRARGREGWFVGGCVRDALLGLPVDDIDVATDAPPNVIAEIFDAAFSAGAHFGVMLVPSPAGAIEVATFRAEGAYVDKRRPAAVRFGAFEEDWPRRDFTVNALYFDPIENVLRDPAGGLADMEARILRCVGDAETRFDEDALRLLRGIRFAARFDLTIEPATEAAMRAKAAGLAEISAERVAGELLKILGGPRPGWAVMKMQELGFWHWTIPEIEAMAGCDQPPEYHPEGDVLTHTALVLDRLRANADDELGPSAELDAALVWAALLHDVGKPPTQIFEDRIRFPEHQRVGAEMAEKIGERLRLPRKTISGTRELVYRHMQFMDAQRMKPATLRRFLATPDFDLHLALHRADCEGSHGGLDNYWFCREELRRHGENEARAAALPDALVDGRDIMALGLAPGPAIGAALEAVRDEQLEGRLAGKAAALEWLRANPQFFPHCKGADNATKDGEAC